MKMGTGVRATQASLDRGPGIHPRESAPPGPSGGGKANCWIIGTRIAYLEHAQDIKSMFNLSVPGASSRLRPGFGLSPETSQEKHPSGCEQQISSLSSRGESSMT